MKRYIFFFLFLLFFKLPILAPETADEIAQQMQNPLASMIAVPVLNGFGFEASQNEGTQFYTSFQPIFPFKFKKFNVMNRVIFGYGYVPGIVQGTPDIPIGAPQNGAFDGTWGLSDLNYSFYITSKKPGKVPWGIGPSLSAPLATDNRLGTGKWSAGLSFVMVYQVDRWTFDLVLRQTWSFAGDSERWDVNQFLASPLIAYGLGGGWTINTFPQITANWDFEESQVWTVPFGGGISKLVFFGKLPTNLGLQYYHSIVRPELAPHAELRFTMTFVFAK